MGLLGGLIRLLFVKPFKQWLAQSKPPYVCEIKSINMKNSIFCFLGEKMNPRT